MDAFLLGQLVVCLLFAGLVNAVNRAERAPGLVGIGLAVAAAFFMNDGSAAWAIPVAVFGIGLGLSPLLRLQEDGLATPGLLIILACAVACGSTSPGADFFVRAAIFASGIAAGGLASGFGLAGGSIGMACLALGAADLLGKSQLGNPPQPPGFAMAGALAAVLLIVAGLASFVKGLASWSWILGALLAAGFGFLVCSRVLFSDGAGFAAIAGALVAGAIVWAMPSDEQPRRPTWEGIGLIGAIVMVAVGTAAFAEARGFGMAAAAIAAVTVGLASNSPRALAATSPLVILVAFRAFGIVNPDAAKALDIGQHYGMIGVMAGVLFAFIAAARSETARFPANALGWTGAALLCATSPLAIGAKGAVGLLAGLGFAGALGAANPQSRNSLAGGISFAGVLIASYGFLKDKLAYTREERLPLLAWVGGIALILFVASLLLNRPKGEDLA